MNDYVIVCAGQQITFSELVGMEELQKAGPLTVSQCRAHSFYVDFDSTNCSPYQRGGMVTQVSHGTGMD